MSQTDLSETSVAAKPHPSQPITYQTRPALASWTFGVLLVIMILDFIDRWVLAAVLSEVKEAFVIGDDRAGFLPTLYLASFTFASPLIGWMADRTRRVRLLGISVAFWSLATLCCGLATTYEQLAAARAMLGIGEATYAVVAPTILVDLFRREVRGRILSLFYLGIPIGGALGFLLGGMISAGGPYLTPIGEIPGWRMAFFVVGAPGLIAALIALFLPEPERGASDRLEGTPPPETTPKLTSEDYLSIVRTPSYWVAVLAMAAYTFAIGALVFFYPTFLRETRGIESITVFGQEMTIFLVIAGITTVSSITGTLCGGFLCDRLARTDRRAFALVPGFAMLAAVPFAIMAIVGQSPAVLLSGIFLAELLMFANTGPGNAMIAGVIRPQVRAAAFALTTFLVHVLGDLTSSWIVGNLSVGFGTESWMGSAPGRFMAGLGLTPTASPSGSLQNQGAGLLFLIPAILTSALIFLFGARFLPRDLERQESVVNAGKKT